MKPFICARHFTAERQSHSPQESHIDTLLFHLPIQSQAPTGHVVRMPEEQLRKSQGEVWDLTEKHLKITF